MNGDGYDDLLVDAHMRSGRAVWVVWGRRGHRTRPLGLSRRRSHLWERDRNLYVTAIGDLDGDGRDDLTANDPELGPSLNVVLGRRWRGGVRAGRARPPGVRDLVTDPGGVLLTQGVGDVSGDGVPNGFVRDAQPTEESYSERIFVVFGRRPLQPVSLGSLGDSGFEIR